MTEFSGGGREKVNIASGGVYPELLDQILAQKQDFVDFHKIDSEPHFFPDGEHKIHFAENLRKRPLFLLQTFLDGANDYSLDAAVMELLLMADAAKRADATDITAVMPLFPYARQDRKDIGRTQISARLICDMLGVAGVKQIITVDIHAQQEQGFFDGSFDNLPARSLLEKYIAGLIQHGDQNKTVLVAPDEGRLKENQRFGTDLDLPVVFIPKSRGKGVKSGEISRDNVAINGVDGKTAIIIDDMIDTAGTLVSAADALAQSGAASVLAIATHGLFSLPDRQNPDKTAFSRIGNSPIDKTIVTDTVPQTRGREIWDNSQFEVLSIAPMLAQAMARNAAGESVSEWIDSWNNH